MSTFTVTTENEALFAAYLRERDEVRRVVQQLYMAARMAMQAATRWNELMTGPYVAIAPYYLSQLGDSAADVAQLQVMVQSLVQALESIHEQRPNLFNLPIPIQQEEVSE